MRHLSVFAVALVLLSPVTAPAATPPDKVTFQGLLADPVGDPLHGFFDVVADFYDASTAGNQILVEEHLPSGSGSVAVNNGRLAVQLGTGVISDGSGPGTYTTLTAVFADFSEVWIELMIEGETLSPRIAVTSTPLALNSTRLDGRAGSEFLDLSPTPQAKVGRLSATTLAVDGQDLEFAGGATITSTAASTEISAGTGGTENLILTAGAGTADGGIAIEGGGGVGLFAGDGTFTFSDGVTDAILATLSPSLLSLSGEIQIQGGSPGVGKVLTSDATGRAQWSNPSSAPTDDLSALAELVGFPATELPPYSELYDDHCALGASNALLYIDGSLTGTVLGWVGRDAISEVYEYRVAFSSGSAIDPEGLLGLEAFVRFIRALPSGSSTTYYRGWITEAAETGSSGGSRRYVIAISPKLVELAQNIGSRTFLDQTVSDITEAVMGDYVFDHTVATTSFTFDRILQWSESDLDFLMRLWERDGIHFHHVQDSSSVTTMVHYSNSVFPTLPTPLSFFGDQVNPGTGEEFIATFSTPRRTFIGDAEVRSIDITDFSPGLDPIIGNASLAGGIGSTVEWHSDVEDSGHANLRALVVASRNRAERHGHRGSGAAADLHGGTVFTLIDTVNGDLNDNYLVTRVTNFARVAGSCVEYGNAFDAIPSSVPFRPPLTTPRPVAEGPMTAVVTDLDDVDDVGQIQVRYHIDDDPVVAWAQVIAPTGKGLSDVYFPEVGEIVVVDFIANDPFRPFIIGSVIPWDKWNTNLPLDPDEPWFTPGVGTMVDGHLYMWRQGRDSPATEGRNQTIFFNDVGTPDAAWLRYMDSEQSPGEPRFELSHDLHLMQGLVFDGPGPGLSGLVEIDGQLHVSDSGDPNPDLVVNGNTELNGDLRFPATSKIEGLVGLDIGASANLDLASTTGSWNAGALLDLEASLFDLDGGSFVLTTTSTTINTGVNLAFTSTLGSWNAGSLLDLDATTINLDGGNIFMNTTAAINIDAGSTLSLQATTSSTFDGGDSLDLSAATAINILGGTIVSLDGGTEVLLHADSVTTEANGEPWVMIDANSDSTEEAAAWYHDGAYDGTGLLATLNEDGDFQIKGMFISGPVKSIAQSFPIAEQIEPGWLVSLDPDRPGEIRPTSSAGDPLVLGVVSDQPGLLFGGPAASEAELAESWGEPMAQEYRTARSRLRQHVRATDTKALAMTPEQIQLADAAGDIEDLVLKAFHDERFAAVAVVGRASVMADASQGAVLPGDALSPGPRPGHAIPAREGWPVVGIALEGLTEGQGLIRMYVSRSGTAAPSVAPDLGDPPLDVKSAPQQTSDPWSSESAPALPITMTRADHPSDEVLHLGADGSLSTRSSVTTGLAGMAELLPVSERVHGGEVLVVDLTRPGRLTRGHTAADPTVVGVAIESPGLQTGNNLDAVLAAEPGLAAELAEAEALDQVEHREEILNELQAIADESLVAVVTTGTTYCRVDASYGAISPGDLLSTSPTPGHAQRSDSAAPGTILGKALEPLDAGTGMIRILVMLR